MAKLLDYKNNKSPGKGTGKGHNQEHGAGAELKLELEQQTPLGHSLSVAMVNPQVFCA